MFTYCLFQGRTFSGFIQEFYGKFNYFKNIVLLAFTTAEGKAAYDSTLLTVQENFPQYVKEVEGIAAGSGVPFHYVSNETNSSSTNHS